MYACKNVCINLIIYAVVINQKQKKQRTGQKWQLLWQMVCHPRSRRWQTTIKKSPFAIDKALKCAVETVKSIKCLRSGDLLVEVGSASQSRSLNKISNLAGCPVTASPHRTLNTCKGVIRCRALIDCPKDEILEELKSQGVTDIYNILTKDEKCFIL